jgi:hypothetical protein
MTAFSPGHRTLTGLLSDEGLPPLPRHLTLTLGPGLLHPFGWRMIETEAGGFLFALCPLPGDVRSSFPVGERQARRNQS